MKRKFKFLEWICNLFFLLKRENVYFIRGFTTHEICNFLITWWNKWHNHSKNLYILYVHVNTMVNKFCNHNMTMLYPNLCCVIKRWIIRLPFKFFRKYFWWWMEKWWPWIRFWYWMWHHWTRNWGCWRSKSFSRYTQTTSITSGYCPNTVSYRLSHNVSCHFR